MQISRKKTRRFLLQKLYARIYAHEKNELFEEAFFEWRFDFEIDIAYLDSTYDAIISHQDNILSIIETYAPKFDIESMQKTNILALCIAIAEMLYIKEEIPAKVSINEAIDLSKYFWDDSSKNIVNGILNSFLNHIEKHKEITASHKNYHFFS